MANRKRAIAALILDETGFRRGVDRASKKLSTLTKIGGKGFKAMGSIAAGVMGGLVGGGALGGVALLATEAKKAMVFDDALTRLSISSSDAMGSMEQVKARVLEVSSATGIAKEEVLAGAKAFVTLTGDGKAAAEAMKTFAMVSQATETPMSDVAGSAAAMSQQFGILPGQMEKAFSILIRGGKEGAVELNDMAALTASLGAAYKRFGRSQGLEGMANIGAMFQVAKRDFGTAAEAATGLESLMSQVQAREFDLAKRGVVIRQGGKAGKGDFKDLMSIIDELDKLQVKDAEKFLDAFGNRKEAVKTFEALRNGASDVRRLSVATLEANDVQEDLSRVLASTGGRAKVAWAGMQNQIAEVFDPDVMNTFADAIEGATAGAVVLVGTLANIPGVIKSAADNLFDFFSDRPEELEAKRKEIDAKADAGIAKAEAAIQAGNAALWEGKSPALTSGFNMEESPLPPFMERTMAKDPQAPMYRDTRTLQEQVGLAPPPQSVSVSVKPSREFDVVVEERLANSPRHGLR